MPALFLMLLTALLLPTPRANAQSNDAPDPGSAEKLLLGSWRVAEREFEFGNVIVRHTDGVIHIKGRKDDGTYNVLVTLKNNLTSKSGDDPLPECDGKTECIQSSATEAVGIYSNGRFLIDYFSENWYDDVFRISGTTMRGQDRNGPIVLTKVED